MPKSRADSAPAPPDATGLDTTRLSHLMGYAASRAAITLRKAFARQMAPLDIRVVEFSILMLVAQNPQVNQKRPADAPDDTCGSTRAGRRENRIDDGGSGARCAVGRGEGAQR